jgi:hypothetical protein
VGGARRRTGGGVENLAAGRCGERRLKRPVKEPDRINPVFKNQEYDRVYDREDRKIEHVEVIT